MTDANRDARLAHAFSGMITAYRVRRLVQQVIEHYDRALRDEEAIPDFYASAEKLRDALNSLDSRKDPIS